MNEERNEFAFRVSKPESTRRVGPRWGRHVSGVDGDWPITIYRIAPDDSKNTCVIDTWAYP